MKKIKKKFRLLTLLGIRPDYIRMFKLIKLLDKDKIFFEHVLVHSGQHYDSELYSNFLKELNIRKPDIDLRIGEILKKTKKEGQAYQQALLTEKVYEIITKTKPDAIMFLGDTNTVLASVIVARCGIPIIHIEAGGRSYDWRMPEEKNRIIIDHLSDALYCYLDRYKTILLSESIDNFRIKVIGNIICDTVKEFLPMANKTKILEKLKIEPQKFILITLHREENTVQDKKIFEWKIRDIIRLSKEYNLPVVFPLMPRVKNSIKRWNLEKILLSDNFIVTKPLGFLEFLKLEKEARLIVSDSGTVQEEALILGTPCVVARRSTERPETIWTGATILEGFEGKETLYKAMKEALNMKTNWNRNALNPQGGSPSERVYEDLIFKIKSDYFKKFRQYETLKYNKFVREAFNI